MNVEKNQSNQDELKILFQTRARIIHEWIITNFFSIIFILIHAFYLLPRLHYQPSYTQGLIWTSFPLSGLVMLSILGQAILYGFVGFAHVDQDGKVQLPFCVKYGVSRVIFICAGTLTLVSLGLVLSGPRS